MSDLLEIRVLGAFEVVAGGQCVQLPPSRKTRALLALLAVTGRAYQRERLCEMFWEIPDDPRGSLRWSMSKIRHILSASPAAHLTADRNAVALPHGGIDVDYWRLAPFAAQSLASRTTSELSAAAATFRDAFLTDLSLPRCPDYEAWRIALAGEVEVTRIRILQELTRRLQDEPEQALPYANALRALLPDDEDILRQAEIIGEAARQRAASPAQPRPRATPANDAAFSRARETAPRREQAIRFCTAQDGARIAYATIGKGPTVLRAAHWLSHLEFELESPVWRHWIEGVARDATLVRYDERGNGLSDWNVGDLSFGAMVSDLERVADAAGLEQFTLLGISQSCAVSVAYAVRHPRRVSHLILYGGYVKGWRRRGNPREIAVREALATLMREGWGRNNALFRQLFASRFIPNATAEQIGWLDELQRATVSPDNAWRLENVFADIDVSDLLPQVQCPTLVIHARGDAVAPLESGMAFATRIPGARFVELESENHILLAGEPAFADFLDLVRTFTAAPVPPAAKPVSIASASPLFGREAELLVLRQAFDRAKAGSGQTIVVAGEAGIGKSRLVDTFAASVLASETLVIRAGAHEFDAATSYAVVKRLLQDLFRLLDRTGPETARRTAEGRIAWLGADSRIATPLLFVLDCDIAESEWASASPQDRARRIRDAVAVLLSLEAQHAPILLIIEDLHWIDRESEALLARLAASIGHQAILVVATTRPEREAGPVTAGGARQIRLDALSQTDAIDFLRAMLGNDRSLTPITQTIATQTGRVPLFMEEVVRSLVDDGRLAGALGHYVAPQPIPALPVPPSVGSVIATRIGQLTESDRRTLQIAAVIGTDFPVPLLERLAGASEAAGRDGLERLRQAGFIVERQLYPVHRFGFRHAVIEAVAYRSLSAESCARLHGRLLEILESGQAADPESGIEILARHAVSAGEKVKAISYKLGAARRALERSAHQAALDHLADGLTLLDVMPEGRERWRMELDYQKVRGVALMAAKGWGAREVSEAYERAEALCSRLGDETELFTVLRGRAQYFMISGQPEAADQIAERCAFVARPFLDEGIAIETHHMGWTNRFFMGDAAAAANHAQRGIELYRAERDHALTFRYSGHDPGVCCRCFSGLAHWLKGEPGTATQLCRDAVALSEHLSHPLSTALACWGMGYLHMFRREPEETLRWSERGMEICEEYALPLVQSQCIVQTGWAVGTMGDLEHGIAEMQRGLNAIKTTGAGMGLPYLLGLLAEAQGRGGALDAALATIREARTTAAQNGGRFQLSEILRINAELLERSGRSPVTEIEAMLRSAVDVARAQRAKFPEISAARSLARFLEGRRRHAEADALMAAYLDAMPDR